MAEQDEPTNFKFIKAGDSQVYTSSRDYTGQGYATYPNGDQYNGDYVDGIRQGKGKYIFANGNKYQGDFKANRKHGIGKLTYKGKQQVQGEEKEKVVQTGQYYGQWENGLKHGQGTYTYKNKDSYSGWWQFGKKKGKGTYSYASTGMKLIGDWEQNKIVEGKWIFPNGTFYTGKFLNNKPNGEGSWSINNGNKLTGIYKQTVIPNEDNVDENQPKETIKLDWISESRIVELAKLVNDHENF